MVKKDKNMRLQKGLILLGFFILASFIFGPSLIRAVRERTERTITSPTSDPSAPEKTPPASVSSELGKDAPIADEHEAPATPDEGQQTDFADIGPEHAPALYQTAAVARSAKDIQKAVALIRVLRERCAGTKESAQALLMLAEMATTGEAPSTLLNEAYEGMLAERSVESLGLREKALGYFRDLDSANDWMLNWQYVIDHPKAGRVRGAPFVNFMTVVRETEGKEAYRDIIAKAVERLSDNALYNSIKGWLTWLDRNNCVDEAFEVAREIALKYPESQAGSAALWWGWRKLAETGGEEAQMDYLRDFASNPKAGATREKAKRRLSDHYLARKDIEGATAAWCDSPRKQDLFQQAGPVIERAARDLAKLLDKPFKEGASTTWGGPKTAPEILVALADIAESRGMSEIALDLYGRAGLALRRPAVVDALTEASTERAPATDGLLPLPPRDFSGPDMLLFWKAYARMNSDSSGARQAYEELLARHDYGWPVGQMMYDIAEWHFNQRQFTEATQWVERGLVAMPDNSALGRLSESIRESMSSALSLATRIEELRGKMETAPSAADKAKCGILIAEAEAARGDHDAAVEALRSIWETYPEAPDAPKAMWMAADILASRQGRQVDANGVLEELILCYPGDAYAAKANAALSARPGPD
jgi:tetratricopeptide (TPR) repeat protein